MNTSVNNKVLPFKVKLGQAIGNLGSNLLMLLNSYFLLYVYTDVIMIPAAAASVILLVARVWDAINDPMMGAIVDKTKSKEGKCLFWLKYFSLPAGVIIILSFWCPELSQPAKIAWVAFFYILQGMIHTVLGVAGNALIVRVTDNSHERVQIQQMESFFSTVLNALIPAITLPLVNATGHGDLSRGFLIVVILYSVVYSASKFISYVWSRGYDNDPVVVTSSTEDILAGDEVEETSTSTMTLIKEALKNKYAVITSIIYIFYLLIASIIGSSLVYYVQYTAKNMALLSVYSTVAAIGGLVSILLLSPMNKKFGNAKSCGICALILALGEFARIFTHDSNIVVFAILMFFMAGASLSIGAFSLQCIMDACTYGRLKTGVNNQGITMSLYSFSSKAGQAIGGALVAALIATVPYVPQAEEQAESVQRLFFHESVTIPMVLAALLFFGFFFLVAKYEKELNELKATLAETESAK